MERFLGVKAGKNIENSARDSICDWVGDSVWLLARKLVEGSVWNSVKSPVNRLIYFSVYELIKIMRIKIKNKQNKGT